MMGMPDRENHGNPSAHKSWGLLLSVGIMLLPLGCLDGPSLLPIDSVVEFRFADDPGHVTIQAQTRRQYGCLGYTISLLKSARPTPFGIALDLELLGVRPPGGICATAIAPANGTTSFGSLPVGRHLLHVLANNSSVTAFLEVTSDSLIVTGGN